jgi:DNA polymerase elongation subunit (family B)
MGMSLNVLTLTLTLNLTLFKKLNVKEFETRYKSKTKFEIKENPSKSLWFTPAIPFPSFDRKLKVKKETRRKKLQKMISDISQADKCSIVSSNGSITSTLTQIESDYSQFISSIPPSLTPTTTSLDMDIIPATAVQVINKQVDLSQSLMKSKKKVVRFNEETPAPKNNDENSNDSSNLSSVSQPIHDKTIDYSELSICDETINNNNNESMYLDSSKMSFYEYNSMLMPKCTKFIDSLVCTQDLTTTIIEPKLPSSQQKNDFKHNIELTNLTTTESNCLTLLSMELYVNTRENLQPNPELDSIGFICYSIYTENNKIYENNFILYDSQLRSLATTRFICTLSKKYFKTIDYVYSEEELIKKFIQIVQLQDPDILLGFEIQKTSWCFLIKRALKLGINDICKLLSRLPKSSRDSVLRVPGKNKKSNEEPFMLPQDLQIAGRIVLNLWRILRSEISLNIYTFENCCYHILHERTPKYSYALLTSFFKHRTDLLRWKTIDYYAHRTLSSIKMLHKLNLISKTSEFARVYGIEFYHVMSRGSQYRVESMMIRIAKKLNYIPVSPSVQQKTKMRAPECIPLTLEPESKFYTEPVAILDFQSLYPSVIIAFNICYTTCLGRVESIGKDGCFKFGCTSLFIPDDLVKSLDFDRDVYFAPSGVAFVKTHIRKGVLPIMLEDILKTRVMVKNSMKIYKSDQNLIDLLDARQLSLKLIANVTFGYTAANFSGRMPCTEVSHCTDMLLLFFWGIFCQLFFL